jgi:hypothetical protein
VAEWRANGMIDRGLANWAGELQMEGEREAFEAMVADGYGDLSTKLEELLYELRPLGVCMPGGAPRNEYEPEVRTILPRLPAAKSGEDVVLIMHEEFDRWFGSWSVRPDRLHATADAIWKVWFDEQKRRRRASGRA